ncbi:hypothetical protein APR08_003744 [Nocardia amikacinitolerans]|nr:hypothetical protein [Nocardia amikacinitolerans]
MEWPHVGYRSRAGGDDDHHARSRCGDAGSDRGPARGHRPGAARNRRSCPAPATGPTAAGASCVCGAAARGSQRSGPAPGTSTCARAPDPSDRIALARTGAAGRADRGAAEHDPDRPLADTLPGLGPAGGPRHHQRRRRRRRGPSGDVPRLGRDPRWAFGPGCRFHDRRGRGRWRDRRRAGRCPSSGSGRGRGRAGRGHPRRYRGCRDRHGGPGAGHRHDHLRGGRNRARCGGRCRRGRTGRRCPGRRGRCARRWHRGRWIRGRGGGGRQP